jgi:hypothetical protein
LNIFFHASTSASIYFGLLRQLLDDVEIEMGYIRGLYHTRAFKFNGLAQVQMLEQSYSVTQQDGNQVDMDIVEKSHL